MCILHGKEKSLVLRCCIAGNNENRKKERRGRFDKKRDSAMSDAFGGFKRMPKRR